MDAQMYDLKQERYARNTRTTMGACSPLPMALGGLEMLKTAQLWSVMYVAAMVRFHVSLLHSAWSHESKPLKNSAFPY